MPSMTIVYVMLRWILSSSPQQIGWQDKQSARRLVIVITDANYHFAGDGLVGQLSRCYVPRTSPPTRRKMFNLAPPPRPISQSSSIANFKFHTFSHPLGLSFIPFHPSPFTGPLSQFPFYPFHCTFLVLLKMVIIATN